MDLDLRGFMLQTCLDKTGLGPVCSKDFFYKVYPSDLSLIENLIISHIPT